MKKSFSKRFDLPAVRSGLLVSILSYKFKTSFRSEHEPITLPLVRFKKSYLRYSDWLWTRPLFVRGLILQICVLSHSEPRHTIANQKPNYKDFGIYRKIKKESCLCVVAKMTFKGQETARKQHRDMTLILPFYRSYDKFLQNLYNLALSGLLSVWARCGYFSQYIL